MKGYYILTWVGIVLLSVVDVYHGRDQGSFNTVNVTYGLRRTVNLTCSVPNTYNITVVWSKKGVLSPLAIGDVVLLDKDRYRVYVMEDAVIFSLKMPGVSDAGVYECTYTVDRDNINRTFFFLTREGKQFTDIVTEKKVVKAAVGDDVHLPCVIQRRHRHKVLWLDSDDRVVTYGMKSLKMRFKISSRRHRKNWTLTIKRVRNSDFGHYICLVSSDPVLSHIIILHKKEYTTVHTTTSMSSLSSTTVEMFQKRNATAEGTSTTAYSDMIPNIGASYTRHQKSDTSQDHLILGASICGFILSVVFVAGCYLFHRMQKMTRRIVQQEIQQESTRMRRRDRRLTSETQVYIDKYKRGNLESFTETRIDSEDASSQRKKSQRNNPYCDPWSSNSDIIAAMNAAYHQKGGSLNSPKLGDHSSSKKDDDGGVNDPHVRFIRSSSTGDINTEVTCMDISRGEGEGESEDTDLKDK